MFVDVREVRRHFLKDKDFYASIDETGYKNVSWAALEIGILTEKMYRIPVHIQKIDKTDAKTVAACVSALLVELFPDELPKQQFKVFVTDSASTMIAAGELLKKDYPNLVHVFCLAHKINRIAVMIKEQHKLLFKVTGLLKQLLARSLQRNQLLWEFTGGKEV